LESNAVKWRKIRN